MANITVTSALNHDDAAASGLLNGDDYIINGGALTINSDVRWGQNAAFIGNINISATLGGSVLVDGRDVWWLPYDAPTGNVPALGTQGVQNCTGGTSAATGEFLGIWSTLPGAPAAAGGAIPATGWIKFRSKVGNFVDNEVITLPGGATVTVNSATGGQRGWIHLVGEEAQTITVPRLGLFQTRGDWFELGTTNGADDQTFQYPVADACPAIQIETAPGSGIYEWYLNAGSRWGTATQYVSTDARGKFFGMDNATGVITIARRASNSCGFKPASGCRVRIPNIIVSNSTTAAPTVNSINATLATRWDFTTTSAGAIDIRNTCGNWYMSFTSAFSVDVRDSATLHAILVSNTAGSTTFQNFAIGLNSTTEFTVVTASNLFTDLVMTDCRFARYAAAASGNVAMSITDCANITMTRVQSELFGSTSAQTRGNATVSAYLFTRCFGVFMQDCVSIGARTVLTTCAGGQISGHQYADQINGTTTTTNAIFAFSLDTGTVNIDISGFSNFGSIANLHPRSGLFTIATGCQNITIRNIGTAASPYNMGTVNVCLIGVTSSVTLGLTLRRIYLDNTGTSPLSLSNTVQNVVCDNVWGDGADTQAIAAVNFLARGCRWTNSVTGQASVYGRHWEDAFTSTTAGRILIAMNEPLAATADQAQITAGTPAFTSGGQVAMASVGDEVVWTMPYFCLGYTSLANIAPTITGASTGNMSYEYQIDTGSGFGSYKTLTAANLSGETISPTTGFRLRVKATTTVANTANALTYIRINGVTNSSDQQTQYPLPFDAVGSVTGIVAGSRIQVYNVTTDAEILNQIVSGTSLSYSYYNGVGISAGDVLRIRLAYVSGATARLPQEITAVASATGFAALASQQLDTVYNTNAIDGSTVTELSADYPNIQIDSNDVDGETTVQRIYAWFAYNQFTSSGIDEFFNAVVAEDFVNYRIRAAVADLKLDNVISTPLMIIGGRFYRDDGATVIAATSNSIQLDPDKAYPVEVGTSGLTPTESDTLAILSSITENVGGLRFTTKALEQAPAGGGGGGTDWTAGEREQIRHRLGIDGTAAAPSATPSLARPSDIPAASANASAVRTELSTELARIDATVSSRLATAGYTAPPTAAQVRTEIDANSTKLDVAVSTRLASASYTAAPSASANASAVRTELATELGRIDASVSSRLSSAGYTAPANADIAAIKAKTDNLPADPADESSLQAAIAGVSAPSASSVASAVRTELATELGRIDAAVSSRLATAGYTAPANADIAAIKAKTDNLPSDPADNSEILSAISSVSAPSASSVASAVRTELAPELGRIDADISSRADQASVDAVKTNTDLIPAAL